MKKVFGLFLVLLLTVSVCGAGYQVNAASKNLSVALLLNGNLGDKSFFDSANAGLQRIKNELGVKTKLVEMGSDQTKWEPTLADISDENWDIIIVGTWQMSEILAKIAPQHPKKKYILFDSSVDYSKGKFANIYSIEYKQNEGSFLAGVLAAKATKSTMAQANKEKVIGFVGGMDIPVINDFLVGYIQGAKYEEPAIKVATSYIGDFFNSAKGKEMALALYNQKADVIFSVASQAGLGALDAAKGENKYVIGVDSDQSMLFKDSDPAKANLILTSVLKRVDNSLVRALKLVKANQLKWGRAEALGVKEGAIGIAKNEFYKKNIPDKFQKDLENLEKQIVSGKIKVESALGMSTAKLNEIRNSVKL
ncbi:nucleoside-binding protein [Hydrogenispora ethanolica]|uniref:Nucleoside-binding protein n=1 Tax=Hydrogenispora ethanolica TaxID=1082276 RepID=A0A4R1RIH2_HYDET|nr:BMP family ABC transporter substrate-binding protein [Hydrogenispora ethanolica]TCL65898.1 nucleoside-binding protein [Hydrogenispora ethanolica]